MLCADMFVAQPLGFFGAVGQYALALMAQRQIDGCRHLFPHGGVAFDLFANGFDGRMRTQEAVRQSFIFPKQTQEEVLGFYERASELASLVACKKYDSPGFFRITFKHTAQRPRRVKDPTTSKILPARVRMQGYQSIPRPEYLPRAAKSGRISARMTSCE